MGRIPFRRRRPWLASAAEPAAADVVTIAQLSMGATGSVCGFHELNTVSRRRLRHQGIVIGAEITVDRRSAGQGRVLQIGRSRIAVSPAVAAGVLVRA